MYRCGQCLTAYVWPMPTDEYLAKFYSEYHEGGVDDGNYACEDKMRRKHPVQLDLVTRIMGRKPDKLLDLGCGKGFFLEECVKRGISCRGIELSDTAIDYARNTLKLDAICGAIHDHVHDIGRFDAVVMWGVIEHVRDPVAVLRDAYKVLEPGGYMFVDTGIGNDWLDRLMPGVNQWYDPPQHLFVFSALGLKRCLQEAGFTFVDQDLWFDYSMKRRLARVVRNGIAAAALRTAATIGRLKPGKFEMTKFSMGNEMVMVGRKPQ
jgi:SAM-dependent methyltransferase